MNSDDMKFYYKYDVLHGESPHFGAFVYQLSYDIPKTIEIEQKHCDDNTLSVSSEELDELISFLLDFRNRLTEKRG